MGIALYKVGHLFKEGRTSYPEGCRFDISDLGATLILYFRNPTNKEIFSIQNEEIKYTYTSHKQVIYMLFKFGQLNWLDCPYTVHLSKNLTLSHSVDIANTEGLGLAIYLVDAASGILKAMRYIGMSHDFSVQLFKDVKRQSQMSFAITMYDKSIQECYDNFSTNTLVRLAQCPIYSTK